MQIDSKILMNIEQVVLEHPFHTHIMAKSDINPSLGFHTSFPRLRDHFTTILSKDKKTITFRFTGETIPEMLEPLQSCLYLNFPNLKIITAHNAGSIYGLIQAKDFLIEKSGNGEIKLFNLTESLTIDASHSDLIVIDGYSKDLTIKNRGNTPIFCKLFTDYAKIYSYEKENIFLHCQKNLSIYSQGNGVIRVDGDPKISLDKAMQYGGFVENVKLNATIQHPYAHTNNSQPMSVLIGYYLQQENPTLSKIGSKYNEHLWGRLEKLESPQNSIILLNTAKERLNNKIKNSL